MRTKKVFYAALAAMALAVAFTACKKDQTAQDEPKVAVTSITLSHTADTLTVGETLTLTPTVLPADATNKAVAWTSSNAAVASISTANGVGKLTAHAEGVAKIIVTTEDGAKKATCTVTVSKAVVRVSSVTLSLAADTLTVGEALILTPTVLPTDATNKAVAWTSGNTAVATVSSGTVTALSAGTAAITATTQDGSKKATCTVTVTAHPFGTISFASTKTWTVGSQTWSDAVTATGCNKTTYNGNNVDCRSNPSYKGDLFSWYAVDTYKNKLCPDGWRVPTSADFCTLDKTLNNRINCTNRVDATSRDKYWSSVWGGSYGGNCSSGGSLYSQGADAYYWSQSEYSAGRGFSLNLGSGGYVYPQYWNDKVYGFTLRCVR